MKPLLFTNIDNKAEDTSVLHITGNEEVEGTKNFNTAPQIDGSNTAKDSDVVHINGNEIINGIKTFGYINFGGDGIKAAGSYIHFRGLKDGDFSTQYGSLCLYNHNSSGSDAWFLCATDADNNVSVLRGSYDGKLLYKNQELPMPVGTLIYQFSTGTTNLNGYLLCNGGAVSRITYDRLFTAIGTTYGSGDGSTTFNLPNLINKVAWGDTTAGTYYSAGLPNITGQAYLGDTSNISWPISLDRYSGAITKHDTSGYITTPGGQSIESRDRGIKIDASLSNSIYGNSSTVQPPALTLVPYIKY